MHALRRREKSGEPRFGQVDRVAFETEIPRLPEDAGGKRLVDEVERAEAEVRQGDRPDRFTRADADRDAGGIAENMACPGCDARFDARANAVDWPAGCRRWIRADQDHSAVRDRRAGGIAENMACPGCDARFDARANAVDWPAGCRRWIRADQDHSAVRDRRAG